MSKLNSEVIKQMIVNVAIKRVDDLVYQFADNFASPEQNIVLRQQLLEAINSIKNWKRDSKSKWYYLDESVDRDRKHFFPLLPKITEKNYLPCIGRVFDCKPLDDQLRAYVWSDTTDSEVLGIEIKVE